MRHPSFGRYTESRRSTGRCTSYPRTLSAAQRCRSYYQRSSPEAARQHPPLDRKLSHEGGGPQQSLPLPTAVAGRAAA